MSALTTIVRRFAYPAQAPFVSLTLYYALLAAVSTLLLWLVPDLRQAFTGARLAELAGQGMSFSSDPGSLVAGAGEWLSWRFALLLGVAMIGAFLLMVPASWVYMATRRTKGFDQGVVQTMVILALSVAGVVVITRNSIALAFSLAGIVGAVQFRNTLKDSRDTLYVFLAIGVGLAAGVEALAAAAVLSLVFNYITLAIWRTDYGMCELGRNSGYLLLDGPRASMLPAGTATGSGGAAPEKEKDGKQKGNGEKKPYNSVLIVRAKQAAPGRQIIEPFLARETKRWELAQVETNAVGGESVLKYRVRLGKKADLPALEDALLALGGPVIGARIQ